MVFVQKCESYDQELVLERVRELCNAHGGLERYVSPGTKVVIKPNLVAKRRPEDAVTTHPALVWAVSKLCVELGAQVTIAESPGGLYDKNLLKGSYRTCGMEWAASESGASLNYDLSETEVDNPEAVYLKKLSILTPVAEADVVINIAKLKTHGMMVYTGAVKNLFGCIAGLSKAEYHFKMSDYDEFANSVIDICLAAKPTFHILDAVVGMERDGPTSGDPKHMGLLLSSPNPFELDLAALAIIQVSPQRVPVLKNAIRRGLCPVDVTSISWKGVPLEEAKVPDFVVKYNDDYKKLHFLDGVLGKSLNALVRPKPVFHSRKCRSCGECAKCCPAKVITVEPGKCAKVNLESCIRCYCCQELCPFHAVSIHKPLLNRLFISR